MGTVLAASGAGPLASGIGSAEGPCLLVLDSLYIRVASVKIHFLHTSYGQRAMVQTTDEDRHGAGQL